MNMPIKTIIPILFLSLVFISCRQNPNKNFLASKSLISRLDISNDLLLQSSKSHYYEVKDKLNSPIFSSQVLKWLPSIEKLMSSSQISYNSLQNLLNKKDKLTIEENVKKCMDTFRKVIISLETDNREYFIRTSTQISTTDSISFEEMPNELLLVRFQNEVRSVENSLMSYYSSVTSLSCNMGIVTSSLLVGQNTKSLKKGESLEISAGVGEYSRNANLSIKINNNLILDTTKIGLIEYKFFPTGNVGKHTLPVIINYLDNSGKPATNRIDVEYTIED